MVIYLGCDGNLPYGGGSIQRYSFYNERHSFPIRNTRSKRGDRYMTDRACDKLVNKLRQINPNNEDVVILTWGGTESSSMSNLVFFSFLLPFKIHIIDLHKSVFCKSEFPSLKKAFKNLIRANLEGFESSDMADACRIFHLHKYLMEVGVPSTVCEFIYNVADLLNIKQIEGQFLDSTNRGWKNVEQIQ